MTVYSPLSADCTPPTPQQLEEKNVKLGEISFYAEVSGNVKLSILWLGTNIRAFLSFVSDKLTSIFSINQGESLQELPLL